MLIHFGQSSYFKANRGVDRYLLETYLLPGLENQAVIAGSSRGIELPVGANQDPEYLSLEEAKSIVLDWLTQNHNLLESDKKKLERVRSYEQFANLASNIYQSKVKDPNKLMTSARLQNIADLRAKNIAGASTTTPHFDAGKAIDDYNRLYIKLLSYSRLGIPNKLLRQVVSAGIPSGAGNLREEALASVISAHLAQLHAAGSVGSSAEAQDYAVSRELGKIIRNSYPEMTGLLNVLGESHNAANLREITNHLKNHLESDNYSLDNYEKIQVAAVNSADNYLLNQAEISKQIINSFPSMSTSERNKLTSAILKEITISSDRPLSASEIITGVGQKLKIPSAELAIIQNTLMESGVLVSIEYRQNELALMVDSRYLTNGERNLLKKGINPFLTHNTPAKLSSLESKLLAEYNAIPGHNKKFVTLREALENETSSTNPNIAFIEHARGHFNQLGAYTDLETSTGFLSSSDQALIGRSRFGRWVTETRSRFYETQTKFFDKWVDLEETITGKKWLFEQLNSWDGFAEKFMIPGTKIPLFRIVPWITDQFESWKKAAVLENIAKYSTSTNWIGKSLYWTLKQYELGEFTVSGATAHFASRKWGELASWALTKTGMSGVLKYAGQSATRTATRLLLKIGGKALARWGAEALGAILSGATVIGTVVFAAGLVLDAAKFALNFVKEFIQNLEFRKHVINFGAKVAAIFASINLGAVFVGLGIMFSEAIVILGITLAIVGGIVLIAPQFRSNIKDAVRLDSGLSQLVSNIVCDEPTSTDATISQPTSSAPLANKTLTCATCLVKYLNQCYGSSVNKQSILSKGISCIIVSIISPGAAEAIRHSAVDVDPLQCVGFAEAAVVCGGGSLERKNACDYMSGASGYRFVSGLGGAQPGDPVIFRSSGTCSNAAPGHIGILEQDAGATVCLVDANQKCAGCPAVHNCLPKTNLAGYLKKS